MLAHTDTHTHLHTQGYHSLAVRFRADRLTSQDRSCPFRVMIPHSHESRGWHPDGLLGCSSFQRCGISFACLSRDRSHKAPQVPGTMGGSFTLPPSPQSGHSTPAPRRRPDPLELPYEGQGGQGTREGDRGRPDGTHFLSILLGSYFFRSDVRGRTSLQPCSHPCLLACQPSKLISPACPACFLSAVCTPAVPGSFVPLVPSLAPALPGAEFCPHLVCLYPPLLFPGPLVLHREAPEGPAAVWEQAYCGRSGVRVAG